MIDNTTCCINVDKHMLSGASQVPLVVACQAAPHVQALHMLLRTLPSKYNKVVDAQPEHGRALTKLNCL